MPGAVGAVSEWLRDCAREFALRADELDELDRVANGIAVPLAHAEELFALRNNIDKVRRRLLAKRLN